MNESKILITPEVFEASEDAEQMLFELLMDNAEAFNLFRNAVDRVMREKVGGVDFDL